MPSLDLTHMMDHNMGVVVESEKESVSRPATRPVSNLHITEKTMNATSTDLKIEDNPAMS